MASCRFTIDRKDKGANRIAFSFVKEELYWQSTVLMKWVVYGIDAGAATYSIDENEEITLNEFFEIMLKSWVKESAVPIQYCGKNANTKDRYDILEKNLIKNKELYFNE